MQRVLGDKEEGDQRFAMHRKEVGWMAFLWGHEKLGIRLLMEQRQYKDGMSAVEAAKFAMALPQTIAHGRVGPYYLEGSALRRNITGQGRTVVLELVSEGQRQGWVATGFPGLKPITGSARRLTEEEGRKIVADASRPGRRSVSRATQQGPSNRRPETASPVARPRPLPDEISTQVGAATKRI